MAPGIAITELVFVSEGAKGPRPILTAPASQVRGERSCNCLAPRGGHKSCAAAESYLPKIMGVRNSSCASRFVFRISPSPVLGTQRKRTQAPNLPPARKLLEVFVKPGGPRRPWKHGSAGTPQHAYVAATGHDYARDTWKNTATRGKSPRGPNFRLECGVQSQSRAAG